MAGSRQIGPGDLVRVGRGTPGGEWFRRYWVAVGLDAELRDIPVAVRVLGEDLVLFRDGEGRPGLLGLHCPHRGTSLEYGDLEPAGLRCPYHGWLFDIGGQCLEQPAEPKGSTFYQRVRHLAYPVRELGGLLFAYLGPDGDAPPPLPRYAPLLERGGQRRFEPVRHWDYNWFNFWENAADAPHLWILHGQSGFGKQTWGNRFFDPENPPAVDYVESEQGLQIVMTQPGPTPDTEFVDTFAVGLPSVFQTGDTEFAHLGVDQTTTLQGHNEHCMFITPNDDDHFMIFTVDHYTGPDPTFFARLDAMRAAQPPPDARAPDDRRPHMPFRGFVRREDYMAQATQGTLGVRAERPAAGDRGILWQRRLVHDAIVAVQEGRRPKGVLTPAEADRIIDYATFVGVRPRTVRTGKGSNGDRISAPD